MRSNKNTAVILTAANNSYMYDSTSDTLTSPGCGYPGLAACSTAGDLIAGVTSAAVAQRDMYEWTERVKKTFPARASRCAKQRPVRQQRPAPLGL